MVKVAAIIAVFLAARALASPGRLQGYSIAAETYSESGARMNRVREKPQTAAFNEPPVELGTEPERPHYLNEDGTDARAGTSGGGDKYTLAPVYSAQDLYDMKNAGAEGDQ